MPALRGFLLALTIALTGVGAGTLTVPLLMLVLGLPAPLAVALGLTFSAAVKLLLAPAQILRGQVSWPTLRAMLLGGLPGVLLGSLLLSHLVGDSFRAVLDAALGLVLIATAAIQIFFHFRPAQANASRPASPGDPTDAGDPARVDGGASAVDPVRASNPAHANASASPRRRAFLLPWLMLPVGVEVGFSSAGAGALGSAALLAFGALSPAQVIGTDILFGAILSLTGALAHGLPPALHAPLLLPMLLGGVPGAFTGLLLATRLPRRPLRLALWIVLLALGGQLVHFGLASAHATQRLASISKSWPIPSTTP